MMTMQNAKQLICPVCKVEHHIKQNVSGGFYFWLDIWAGCPFASAFFSTHEIACKAMQNLIDAIDELENG